MTDDFLESGLIESNGMHYGEPYAADLASLNECSVCLGEHDPEIHSATLSVRSWFRDEVTKSFRIQPEVVV